MEAYPKIGQLLGVFLLQSFPLLLQAQPLISKPLIMMATGVSIEPVMPLEPVSPLELATPVVTLPPRLTPVSSSPIIENRKSSDLPKSSQMPEKALDILDFWFGPLPNIEFIPQDKMSIWLTYTPEGDRQIREIFSQDILNAIRGEYNHWRETPKGRLALILLLDQFPRHLYRNQPQEFMSDRMAQALVLEGLQKGDDHHLYPIERAFFYLPLQHAEQPDTQALSVSAYQRLLAESPQVLRPQMQAFLQYAFLHQKQIASFGRFPHRNEVLGRESTPEEIIFLRQWGKPSF